MASYMTSYRVSQTGHFACQTRGTREEANGPGNVIKEGYWWESTLNFLPQAAVRAVVEELSEHANWPDLVKEVGLDEESGFKRCFCLIVGHGLVNASGGPVPLQAGSPIREFAQGPVETFVRRKEQAEG